LVKVMRTNIRPLSPFPRFPRRVSCAPTQKRGFGSGENVEKNAYRKPESARLQRFEAIDCVLPDLATRGGDQAALRQRSSEGARPAILRPERPRLPEKGPELFYAPALVTRLPAIMTGQPHSIGHPY